MKKITFLSFLLLIGTFATAQCLGTSQYPFTDVVSLNDGSLQQITDCNYAGEYASLTNIIIGNDYEFSSVGGASNYITITDANNTVIAMGDSPVTVNNISVSSVRLHITLTGCGSDMTCHETNIQCVSASCVPPPPPANDECSNAVALTVDATFCNGTNTNGTNEGATDSGVLAATCFEYGENDVWYSFTVPAGVATIDVSTDFAGGTLVDSEVAVYSGTCGSMTEIGCDQDGGSTVLSNGQSWNSLISNVVVTVGQTYFVRVAGYDEFAAGTFCLKVATNTTLSTADVAAETFRAYPNPVKDVLNLSYTSEIDTVSVYNMLGQEVFMAEPKATQSQINMSQFPSGNYIVKVNMEGTAKTFKVLKQ